MSHFASVQLICTFQVQYFALVCIEFHLVDFFSISPICQAYFEFWPCAARYILTISSPKLTILKWKHWVELNPGHIQDLEGIFLTLRRSHSWSVWVISSNCLLTSCWLCFFWLLMKTSCIKSRLSLPPQARYLQIGWHGLFLINPYWLYFPCISSSYM